MNQQSDRPSKKKRTRAIDVESTMGKRPDERLTAAAAERTETDPPAPSPPEPVHRPPVTNQDEQDKITNTTSDDTPNV